MIVATLESWGAWSWIALAALLMALELIVPGYLLIWLGAAAAATGVLFILVPAPWQVQFAVFSVLALACVYAWFRLVKGSVDTVTDQPGLNRRLDAMVGREFVLEEPIQSGRGRVRIADSVWTVTGPDLASGSRVRVTGYEGAVLMVEPA
ncbi:NfeD family protein [Phreatobacter sp.]|uniref:NfeD family protein n=1 Tax=Phreatobacter sp. TaxID=1966341 RepID=UPI003F6FFF4B